MARNLENMEDILKSIGGLGRFQIITLALMMFMEIPLLLMGFLPVIIAIPPDQWICGNETVPASEICECRSEIQAVNPDHSIIEEWSLVCDKAWIPDAVMSLQMVATIAGNLIISPLSDWYGRRYCYFSTVLFMILGSTITALSTGPIMYAVSRVICGISLAGFMTMTAVYVLEFMTPEYRMLPACLSMMGEGVMILSLMAYYIRPWRTLTWLTIAPKFVAFIVLTFVPESPRWLLRNHKIQDCHRVLNRIAKINGKPPIDLKYLEAIAERDLLAVKSKSNVVEAPAEASFKLQKYSYFDLIRIKSLRKVTLLLCVMWFSWGLIFFGVTVNVRNMNLDVYFSLALMGLADAVGFPVAMLLPTAQGRKKVMIIFLAFSAFFLGAMATWRIFSDFSGYQLLAGILVFLGKFWLSAARTPFRTLSTESYPTAVRTMGMGLLGTLASVGAALGPQLVFLGLTWPYLPHLVFAIVSVLQCTMGFWLKETHGTALADDVVMDSEHVKDKKMSYGSVLQNGA